jgi:CII-binding regulator of phage lambda lysogenization HflD
MDSELQVVLAAAPTISAYTQRAEQRTRRLMHNLKSLTAKSSQEIFALFHQQKLMAPYSEALEYVEKEIRETPSDAARAMLSLLKYQAAQKAEYSAFDKLSGKISSLQPEMHDIHRVLMNVFYSFSEILSRIKSVSMWRRPGLELYLTMSQFTHAYIF